MDEINRVIQKLREKQNAAGTYPASSNVDDVCPLCEGRGYTIRRIDGEIFSRECSCEIKRRNARRIERSGLSPLLESCRFGTYQTPTKWQREAKAAALDYLVDWRGKWFFAGGAVGSGKTHLCAALCGELMNGGVDLRFFQWRSDSPKIKALVHDAMAYEDAVNPLKTVRALYVDDFLKGQPTEADRNLAFDVLNARYNTPGIVTILSSEKTIEQILQWDEAIGSRIFEKAKGHYVKITGADKNWRLRG